MRKCCCKEEDNYLLYSDMMILKNMLNVKKRKH